MAVTCSGREEIYCIVRKTEFLAVIPTHGKYALRFVCGTRVYLGLTIAIK